MNHPTLLMAPLLVVPTTVWIIHHLCHQVKCASWYWSLLLIRLNQTPAAVYFSSGILLNAPTSLSLMPCSSGKWSCLCSYACIFMCACRWVSGDRVCSAVHLNLKCAFIFHCEGELPFIPEALLLSVGYGRDRSTRMCRSPASSSAYLLGPFSPSVARDICGSWSACLTLLCSVVLSSSCLWLHVCVFCLQVLMVEHCMPKQYAHQLSSSSPPTTTCTTCMAGVKQLSHQSKGTQYGDFQAKW